MGQQWGKQVQLETGVFFQEEGWKRVITKGILTQLSPGKEESTGRWKVDGKFGTHLFIEHPT